MQNSNSELGLAASALSQGEDMDDYLFPDKIPIDTENTLYQLTGRFRSVKDGMPELVKNSKDQYSRLGIVDREERQILVIASTDRHRLGVIDFAGAPTENFQGWTKWSDPTAGRTELSDDIEAGHGNGGKSFMVRGATDNAYMESCFKGKRTRKGFLNKQVGKRYKPGFAIINGIPIDNIDDDDLDARLEEFLAEFNTSIDALPERARHVFRKRRAFTGVLLSRVKDWEERRKKKIKQLATHTIPELIATHGQTAMTIETCDVWIVVDGQIVDGAPVKPVALEPHSSFDEPLEFSIPDVLPDPETGDAVDMTCALGGMNLLRLCTSARQLQISEETRAKNVIRVWNNRNNVATWPLNSLGVLLTSVSFIYGELRCAALVGEHLAGAERLHLSDTPLVRALRRWTEEKVRDLAEALHQAMMAETRPRDREQARTALSSIRDLMRRYLDLENPGDISENNVEGAADGTAGNGHTRRREGVEYGDRIDEIVLEPGRVDISVINGTAIPLQYRCLEHQEDGSSKPVKGGSVVLKGSPETHFEIDERGNIRAISPGIGEVWLETHDGSVHSNRLEVWVATAHGVEVEIPETPLLQGQRVKLEITFHTPDGPMDDALIDAEVVEPEMGKIGRHSRFTAGMVEGNATIRVRFGPKETDYREFNIPIGSERVPQPDERGDQGSDVPEILFCGDEAPDMEEYPEGQRTVPGGPEMPTIIEDPLFPKIVWINQNSKEAMRVRRSTGGSTGVGRVNSKTFIHFVALKCFDILKRLYIRQQISGSAVTEYQYMQKAVEAEMECADFIDAAWELSDALLRKADADGI